MWTADLLPANCEAARLKDAYGFDSVEARERCLELVGSLPAQPLVADIGTGCGLMTAVLASRGISVTSVDISQENLDDAANLMRAAGAEIASRVRYVLADAISLPFVPGSFDAIFSFSSMHHMPDCGAVLAEMDRVLKPSGRLVIADLNAKGLAAVRALMAEQGESHDEDGCLIESLHEILGRRDGRLARHDDEFVSIFVKEPGPLFR